MVVAGAGLAYGLAAALGGSGFIAAFLAGGLFGTLAERQSERAIRLTEALKQDPTLTDLDNDVQDNGVEAFVNVVRQEQPAGSPDLRPRAVAPGPAHQSLPTGLGLDDHLMHDVVEP